MKLIVDPLRYNGDELSGIYVRAQYKGEWKSVPLESLTFESIFKWMRSSGGNNTLAENTVLALLGYNERITPNMLPQQDEEEAEQDKQVILNSIGDKP